MFITFEGSEGSGKSTHIGQTAAFLEGLGYQLLLTREPGGTKIGEQIRLCLHDVENTAMSSEAEVLLYSASRAQLVKELIRPALEAGKIVLSDRYYDSTIAYQGYGRQLDVDVLRTITGFATGGLEPDLTIYLDVEVDKGLARRSGGDSEINRMDLQDLDFYRRVRSGYLRLAANDPERWVVIDANRDVEAIQADIRECITERLKSEVTDG